jgi:hypothetical protein
MNRWSGLFGQFASGASNLVFIHGHGWPGTDGCKSRLITSPTFNSAPRRAYLRSLSGAIRATNPCSSFTKTHAPSGRLTTPDNTLRAGIEPNLRFRLEGGCICGRQLSSPAAHFAPDQLKFSVRADTSKASDDVIE